jgi:hypothetical protein
LFQLNREKSAARAMRRRRQFGFLISTPLIFTLLTVGPAAGALAQMSKWSVVSSPNGRTNVNMLYGVSCVPTGACTAVGEYGTKRVNLATLIESWSGTRWSKVQSPNGNAGNNDNALYGVSCVASGACTAVGNYSTEVDGSGDLKTLVVSWNGTKWSRVSSPNVKAQDNYLDAVSCLSALACTAVGYDNGDDGYDQTLVESWNGTRWSVVPSPNGDGPDDFLTGVSCVSPSACTAVGYDGGDGYDSTLIESWNGTEWTEVSSPNPGTDDYDELYGVSCLSSGDCKAVGYYIDGETFGTLVESWNGTKWSTVSSPNGSTATNMLYSVSCVATNACTAVGDYYTVRTGTPKTLVESWNGTRWSVVPSPSPGTPGDPLSQPYLAGVSCVSPTACTAVGTTGNRQGKIKTLVESS